MGVPNGFCRWIWDDSSMYIGHNKNGILHGEGKLIYGDFNKSKVQEGEWYNGKFNSGEIYHECKVERLQVHIQDSMKKEIKKQMNIFDLRHRVNSNINSTL